jgi:Divergent InlB B-repeat domain
VPISDFCAMRGDQSPLVVDLQTLTMRRAWLRTVFVLAIIWVLRPTPAAITSDTWQLLSRGGGIFGWYFSHAAVERSGAGRIWHTWNGQTQLFDPATNTWSIISTKSSIGWRENFGSDHDADNGLVWIGPGAPAGPGWDGTLTYSLSQHLYVHTGVSGCGGTSVYAWDQVRKRLYCFAGWGNSNLYAKSTTPDGPWRAMNPGGSRPPITKDGAKLTSWRGGIDSRNGTLWVIADNQAFYRYDPTTNAWSRVPTTGAQPPEYTVFMLDEARNTIVGWIGCNDVVVPCTTVVSQTYYLDLGTLAWSLGPSGPGITPSARVMAYGIPLYDRVRQRVLLLVMSDHSEVWTLVRREKTEAAASIHPAPGVQPLQRESPPLPSAVRTYFLTVTTAGTGSGTTIGAGTHTVGSMVRLAATAARDSTFIGWSGDPDCTDGSVTMTDNRTCIATFNVIGSGGPAAQFQAGVFVARPLKPVGTTPFPADGDAKHVRLVYRSVDGKVYSQGGDFSTPWYQDSENNMGWSYDPASDAWALYTDRCHAAGQVTPGRTDQGAFIYDSRRDRLWWQFGIGTATDGALCTGSAGGQNGSTYQATGLMYYSFTDHQWHTATKTTGTRGLLYAFYDSTADEMIGVGSGGSCGAAIHRINLATFAATVRDFCNAPSPAFSGGTGYNAALQVVHEQPAWDNVNRKLYIVAPHIYYRNHNPVRTDLKLWVYDGAAGTTKQLAAPPSLPGSYVVNTIWSAWDSTNNVLLFPYANAACGVYQALYVYKPATNTWEIKPITQPNRLPVRGNTVLYIPGATNALFSAGSVFCGQEGTASSPALPRETHMFLYRYGS